MVHIDRSSRQIMWWITDLLKSEEIGRDERVKCSLDLLGILHVALVEDPVPNEEFALFKADFSSLISAEQNYVGISGYTLECEIYASRGRLDGFAEACGMRSILQLFNDEFIDWGHVGSSNLRNALAEDLEDIDEMIEDVSDEAPPVREEDIPEWAPESHWWWRAPKQQDMSDAEIKARLEYDHFDGVYD